MKKIILSLILIAALFTPMIVKAEDNVIGAGQFKVTMEAPDTPFLKFENVFKSIFDIVITVSEIVFILLFLAGGVMYLTSGGSDDQAGNAKKLMMNGVIGLVIVLASWAIGNWVLDLLHNRYSGSGNGTVTTPSGGPSVGSPKTDKTTDTTPTSPSSQVTPTNTISPTPTKENNK